jgi:hypothetical protein
MSKETWICSICGAVYNTEKEAEQCENQNTPKVTLKSGDKVNLPELSSGNCFIETVDSSGHEATIVIKVKDKKKE